MSVSGSLLLGFVLALLVSASVGQPDCPNPFSYADADIWSQCPDWIQCSQGVEQSPINIDTSSHATVSFLEPLRIPNTWGKEFLTMSVTEEGLRVTVDQAPTGFRSFPIQLNGGRINERIFVYLKYIEFHTPSEHTINGVNQDMEVQLYFERPTLGDHRGRNWVAVSFFYRVDTKKYPKKGAYNPDLFQMFFRKRDPKNSNGKSPIKTVTASSPFSYTADLFPFQKYLENWPTYYTYDGSFTSPACDQSIEWYIQDNARPMSPDQLSTFQSFAPGGNNRPVQPIGDRLVWRFGPANVG